MLDETYRKAGKMDSECFASRLDPFNTDLQNIVRGYLLEGLESDRRMKAELYKLNIYSKYLIFVHPYLVLCCCLGSGSFFKPHVDTPRSENMFGSLVVVFPTPHEGGALSLRHHGHEWTFDSGKALAAVDQLTIGYVAFFNDIEHEVAPVTSGHRITLTYNLYFDDGERPVSENDAVSTRHLIPPELQLLHQKGFRNGFKALLENPEFMADGGTLGFGLRHVYPIKGSLKNVYNVLKGGDAVVFESMRALGFDPVLYLYYDEGQCDGYGEDSSSPSQGAMVDTVVKFCDCYEDLTVLEIVQASGGIPVRQDGGEEKDSYDVTERELVEWVSPLMAYNCRKDALAKFEFEVSLNWAYGDVCMIVRIGRAGDRWAFPTADQVKTEHKKRWRREHEGGYYY